jgi:hypothetical protein
VVQQEEFPAPASFFWASVFLRLRLAREGVSAFGVAENKATGRDDFESLPRAVPRRAERRRLLIEQQVLLSG